jgi:Saxitoxin biosynthesis operon protein SxtJ
MKWSDVVAVPKPRVLRQFAGLWLALFCGLAAWRAWHGHVDLRTTIAAVAGVVVGVLGLVRPTAIRPVYTGWMMAAFPIGWTVSRLMVLLMFFVVFTPVAFIFRLIGRDALRLRRPSGSSYWSVKTGGGPPEGYLRQS